MIKFVNLQTGATYNGSQPYIHWFEDQQSTGLIYTQPLCFIADFEEANIIMDSEIFSLIDPGIEEFEIIDGIQYKNIESLKVNNISLKGEPYQNYYIYIMYLIASSNVAAEYIDEFEINGVKYNIGADFYNENESLYINASNFGINIPESIQKAIYSTNIREEKKDNILLNRKFKELISNYWDMIANKGSYKSLLNSLKWFEWGDIVRIREIWKHDECGASIYDDREMCSILEDKYKDTLNGFAKTSYVSLYGAMQKLIPDCYDDEKNPKIESIISKWSKIDLMLKICLLGNFFETYFMPIHLNLLHYTMEDIVFTNTIKTSNDGCIQRNDHIYNVKDFECVINDNKPITLFNVSVGVDSNTLFGKPYGSSYKNHNIIGVKPINDVELINDEDLKKFYVQNYNGIGSIVNFKCKIPAIKGDFVKYEQIFIKHKSNSITIDDHKLYYEESGYIYIDFNILLTNESQYDIILRFDLAGGDSYIKNMKINVENISNVYLDIYKLKKKQTYDLTDLLNSPIKHNFSSLKGNDKISTYKQYISAQKSNNIGLTNIIIYGPNYNSLEIGDNYKFSASINDNYVTQKINDGISITRKDINLKSEWEVILYKINPSIISVYYDYILEFDIIQSNDNKSGIELNCSIRKSTGADPLSNVKKTTIENNTQTHVELELDVYKNGFADGEQQIYIALTKQYTNIFNKIEISNIKLKKYLKNYWILKKGTYDIAISKKFMDSIPDLDFETTRNDLVFIPEFHDLEEFGKSKDIKDYEIDNDVLCVIPKIQYNDTIIDFNWRKYNSTQWEFINKTTGERFKYDDISTPLILSNEYILPSGYYDILFRYNSSNNKARELILNSAFIKK